MDERKTDLQQLSSRIRDNIIDAVNSDREEKALKDLKWRLLLSVCFVLPLLAVALTEEGVLWGTAAQIALLIPIIIVNYRVFLDGFSAIHSRRPEKNTLAAIGTILAICILQFHAAGVFLTTMALCRCSEAYVNCKLDDHLKRLIDAEPEDPGFEPGQIVDVPKGSIVPADGVITEGTGVFKEELITGEPVPQEKGPGEPAFAGTRLLSGNVSLQVKRSGPETTISRIIEHITGSIATKAPIAERVERAARLFTLAVVLLAGLSAVLWIASGRSVVDGVTTAVTILIIASPYAFSVGVPMSILAATVRGAKDGILIRSASILELARDINTVAMNKTGTVTGGRPMISDVIRLSGDFSLRLAGALEQKAKHPVGREILRAAREQYGELPEAEQVEEIPGRGMRGVIDGKVYLGGSAVLMQENGISIQLPEAQKLFLQGKSVIFYADENRVIGMIALRDAPRAVSLKAISRIEAMGIDVVMLTGDNAQTAEAIRREVGIDLTYAQILPSEKARIIEELRGGEGAAKLVAMVGDGADDADAIARADMGIAIGAGPEIDVRPTDVILIADDLMDVVRAIVLSRKTIRYIRQDIAFAWCYNVLAIAAAASVLVPLAGPVLSPLMAALCMCASQILVVFSTLRVKRARL